jgi:aliphatic sulfonates family ABC transporter substrate-binding protein
MNPSFKNDRNAMRLAIGCAFLLATSLAAAETCFAAEPLTFAYQDRIADAASIVAVNKGLFAAVGLNVKPLRFSSGPACAEALYSGSADIGTMGDTTAVIAAARKAGLVIIASHGGGEGRHRIVVRPGSNLRRPADLKGKTVGVKKGTSTYGGLLEFLKANDLSGEAVRTVDMRPADMPEALAAGSVDAICASEPTPSLAESRGNRPFADLAGLGNHYPILLMANERFVKAHPHQVVMFLRAMAQATRFVADHPEETADILAQVSGLDRDLCLKAMKRHSYALTLNDTIIESLTQTGKSLVAHGTIPGLPDIREFVRPALLKRALSN